MARNNAAGGAGLLLGGLILASGLVSAEAHPSQLGVVNTREHPVTYPLGMMFLGLALLAIPFSPIKRRDDLVRAFQVRPDAISAAQVVVAQVTVEAERKPMALVREYSEYLSEIAQPFIFASGMACDASKERLSIRLDQ